MAEDGAIQSFVIDPDDANSFWYPPQSTEVLYISSGAAVQDVREYIEGASVIGIDAEWRPGCRAAELLQLACWDPLRGARAIIIDLHCIPPSPAVTSCLLSAFSSPQILLLGISLASDFAALEAWRRREATPARDAGPAQEPESDCALFSSLDSGNMVDLARALPLLWPEFFSGSPARTSGLSEVVRSTLGRPLDKSQQRADWAARPLPRCNLVYAALDALCLLHVFAELLGRMGREDKGASGKEGSGTARSPEREDWRDATSKGLEPLRGALAFYCDRAEQIARDSGEATSKTTRKAPKHRRIDARDPSPPPVAPSLAPGQQATFLCDSMLTSLARHLRLAGVDAATLEEAHDPDRGLVWRRMVERAEAEARIILTCDGRFIQRRFSHAAYRVRAQGKREQFREVVRAFHMRIEPGEILSRCCHCNGDLDERPLRPPFPPGAMDSVPLNVQRRQDEFWVCRSCRHVYWKGSQYCRAKGTMLELMRDAGAGTGGGGCA